MKPAWWGQMNLFKKQFAEPELRCSFCKKSQDQVEKLVSSPSDYPRASICSECIKVASSAMKDDSPATYFPAAHPLEPEFFRLVKKWVDLETRSEDPNGILDRMYIMAVQMFSESQEEPVEIEY